MRVSGTNRQVYLLILWVALLATVVPHSTALAAINPFAEVPDGHWSYRALIRLEELGLSRPRVGGDRLLSTRLTRVELAIEISHILDRLVRLATDADTLMPRMLQADPLTLVDTYNAKVPYDQRLSEADIGLLSNLISTYRPELEALGYRFDSATGIASFGLPAFSGSVGQLQIPPGQISSGGSSGLPSSANDSSLGDFVLRSPTVPSLHNTPPGSATDAPVGGFELIPNPTVPTLPLMEDDVLSRFGGLAGVGWEELALNAPDRPLGAEQGVKVGQLGSTVLVARRGSGSDVDYVAGLDGTLVLDRFTVGATVLRSLVPLPLMEDEQSSRKEGTVAGVQGSYRLTPGIMVTAGLAGSIWDGQDASLLHVGGVLQFSETMSLKALYRLEEPGFHTLIARPRRSDDDVSDPERTGLDLSFDLGYARVTAALGLERWEDQGSQKTTTSVGLMYPFNDLTVFRASRETLHEEESGDSNQTYTTQLGVDVAIPRINMNLKLGYALIERYSKTHLGAERGSETELGVEYQLPSGSVALRYTVVDPGSAGNSSDTAEANLDAAITIRF